MFCSKSGESSDLATGVCSVCGTPELRTFALSPVHRSLQGCPGCGEPRQLVALTPNK